MFRKQEIGTILMGFARFASKIEFLVTIICVRNVKLNIGSGAKTTRGKNIMSVKLWGYASDAGKINLQSGILHVVCAEKKIMREKGLNIKELAYERYKMD